MALKVLIYLCLVAIITASEEIDQSKDDAPVAYSSVYTSFGSFQEELTPSEEYKPSSQNVQDKTVITSVPVHELILNNGEAQESSNDDVEATETKPAAQQIQEQITYSVPIVQAMSSIQSESAKTTVPAQTILAPIAAPAEIRVGSSPPLSSAVIGEGRLITPGLSAYYASSVEETAEPAKAVSSDPKSPLESGAQSDSNSESHTSFDGFGANYSW